MRIGRLAFLSCLLVQGIDTANATEERVVFERDVEPILARRCLGCHGPTKQQGGLRLDSRRYAERGGESGAPLLTTDVASNELLLRVTSREEGYRMPLDGPLLADNEVRSLRSWIEQGANWPDDTEQLTNASGRLRATPRAEPWWIRVANLSEIELQRLGWTTYVVLGALLLVLAMRIVRRRATDTEQPARSSRNWLGPLAQLAAMLIAVGIAISAYVIQIRTELSESQSRIESRNRLPGNSKPVRPSGHIFVPLRPDPAINVTYYRGNDERDPGLYNGGFYRTATLHMSLVRADQTLLEIGDEVANQPIQVRLAIERAPHATPTLFTPSIMRQAILSPVPPEKKVPELEQRIAKFETIQEGEEWVSFYPIESPKGEGRETLSGVIYLCKGSIVGDSIQGSLRYELYYDLVLEDGVLAERSNLEMASAMKFSALQPTLPGKIQQSEWLDFRPIPEIVGGNSNDPELLGVGEHVAGAQEPDGVE